MALSVISLSEAIEDLREELSLAQDAGNKSSLKFTISEIDLELQLVNSGKAKAEAKAGWGVLSLGGGGEVASSGTHKLKLKLHLAQNSDGASPEISGPSWKRPVPRSDQ